MAAMVYLGRAAGVVAPAGVRVVVDPRASDRLGVVAVVRRCPLAGKQPEIGVWLA